MSLPHLALTALSSFAASVLLVPFAARAATRLGMVAQPAKDRWSRRPTPMLGGLAVFAAFVAPLLWLVPVGTPARGIIIAAAWMTLVGLYDDRYKILPQTKLVCQIVGACLLIGLGFGFQLRPAGIMNVVISIFWSVAVMNAINLMDNMDGLATGVSMIAAVFVACILGQSGRWLEAVVAASLAGALAGFLIYNFSPAKVFLGDAGSLSIGVTLAGLTLSSSLFAEQKLGAVSILLAPALVMAIPILDVMLVSATRTLAGRSISQGGRDHTSHRLVALGLSERKAVLLLYGLSTIAGAAALILAHHSSLVVASALIPLFWVALGLFFVYLAKLNLYSERASIPTAALSYIGGLAFKRRLVEVAMDLVLSFACFSAAYLLRFDFDLDPFYRGQLVRTLPLCLAITLASLSAVGLYRGIWEFQGLRDVSRFARGAVLSAVALLVVTVLWTRFDRYPRSVFPLYSLLLFVAICATRSSFRWLEALLPAGASARTPTLIYGIGGLAETAFVELSSRRGGFEVLGFIEDSAPVGRLELHGLPVFGRVHDLEQVSQRTRFDVVVVAKGVIDDDEMSRLVAYCRNAGCRLLRFGVEYDELVPGAPRPQTETT